MVRGIWIRFKQVGNWHWWQFHIGSSCFDSSWCNPFHPTFRSRNFWRSRIVCLTRSFQIQRPTHHDQDFPSRIPVHHRHRESRTGTIRGWHQWPLRRGHWQQLLPSILSRFRFRCPQIQCRQLQHHVVGICIFHSEKVKEDISNELKLQSSTSIFSRLSPKQRIDNRVGITASQYSSWDNKSRFSGAQVLLSVFRRSDLILDSVPTALSGRDSDR